METLDRGSYLAYARDALGILEGSLDFYRRGEDAWYRAAAAQLRLLLCDSNRIHDRRVDISLVPRLFPDLRLEVLRAVPAPERASGLRLVFPGGPGPLPLPLPRWLEQEITSPGGRPVSLRALIRSVCEQDGGAHVDPRPLPSLRAWAGRGELIADLGEVTLRVLRPLMPG
ncbi:MAG TPA: hypothetical protein VF813_09280 [Anaerolineaceae bacterium]